MSRVEEALRRGNRIFITYPVRALLFDAQQGVTLSRILIFEYFESCSSEIINTSGPLHPDVKASIRFVADEIAKAKADYLAGKRNALATMFNPSGRKIASAGPVHRDVYSALHGSRDERLAQMSELSFKNPRDNVGNQKAREDRIWRVHEILQRRSDAIGAGDGQAWQACADELKDIYADPHSLV